MYAEQAHALLLDHAQALVPALLARLALAAAASGAAGGHHAWRWRWQAAAALLILRDARLLGGAPGDAGGASVELGLADSAHRRAGSARGRREVESLEVVVADIAARNVGGRQLRLA